MVLFTGCRGQKSQKSTAPFPSHIQNLPLPDISIEIKGLTRCVKTDDHILKLNSKEPLTVLVHGCEGSAANFRALAEVFAFHGQQTVCFYYDDRDSLMKSSSDLIHALSILFDYMSEPDITLIGHSQGGLIARKALIEERSDALILNKHSALRLITISSPFAGIKAAESCGSKHRNLTLGLAIPICKLISGDKWFEITSASDFIQEPGTLLKGVGSYLKIVTDERNSCRQYSLDGHCAEDDFVFSTDEQYHPLIDKDAIVEHLEIVAGHTEIVGDDEIKPRKLIRIFQRNGIMAQTPLEREKKLALLLDQLF